MLNKRRIFLKQGLGWLLGMCGGLWLKSAHAARNAGYFSATSLEETLKRLFAQQPLQHSDQIRLDAPDVAENGSVVPVTISSELENIRRLYLLVEKNPTPLAAEFELSSQVLAYVGARIKMAESSYIIVVAEHESGLLTSRQWVNVVQGGCGAG